jgi:hypothetical protein
VSGLNTIQQLMILFALSADGRPLSQAEWNEIKQEIGLLKDLVDNISILDDDGNSASDEHA